ncbi:MAG: putative molybdenum carrier protein [Ignavibacteriaceae bacterium]|nr:putative molybdenum carrier protein [Ignavibacteriaceae bacterium]
MINKIISGGQTGADIAGLKFAKNYGIPTGGYTPKEYMTEEGKKPELKDLYGLLECNGSYGERTILNVKESDGTVVFADKMSDGSFLTIETCQKEDKPCLLNPTVEELLKWINDNNIKVLNVAGNRESVSPGIELRVYKFLEEALGKG